MARRTVMARVAPFATAHVARRPGQAGDERAYRPKRGAAQERDHTDPGAPRRGAAGVPGSRARHEIAQRLANAATGIG